MNRTEIANLEHASRAVMAWIPEDIDDKTGGRRLLTVVGILAVAATLLLAVL